MKLHFLEAGRGHPLVFVHGGGAPGDQWWRLQIGAFPGFRQIVLDRAGYGRSKGKPNGNYLKDADDFWETLEAMRLDQVNIVGHSGGGCVGALATWLKPGSVQSLTVIEPTFLGLAQGKALEYRKKLEELVNATNPFRVPETAVESFLGLLVGPQRIAELKSGSNWQAIADVGTNMFLEARYILDSDPEPPTISVPMLVVAGTISPLHDLSQKLANYWNAEFASLEGLGHLLNRTHPERFNAHLIAFLEKHQRIRLNSGPSDKKSKMVHETSGRVTSTRS